MENLDLTLFIVRDGAELITDSRAVAIAFGKHHKHVMRSIQSMLVSTEPEIAEHARSNFGPSSFAAQNGKLEPMFRMTSAGLAELAMSFTGDRSRVTRIRFLKAFKEVSDRLTRAERSITARLHELERRELPSEVKGRVGSMLMNQRRREKPELAAERSALEAIAQPSLLTH